MHVIIKSVTAADHMPHLHNRIHTSLDAKQHTTRMCETRWIEFLSFTFFTFERRTNGFRLTWTVYAVWPTILLLSFFVSISSASRLRVLDQEQALNLKKEKKKKSVISICHVWSDFDRKCHLQSIDMFDCRYLGALHMVWACQFGVRAYCIRYTSRYGNYIFGGGTWCLVVSIFFFFF